MGRPREDLGQRAVDTTQLERLRGCVGSVLVRIKHAGDAKPGFAVCGKMSTVDDRTGPDDGDAVPVRRRDPGHGGQVGRRKLLAHHG